MQTCGCPSLDAGWEGAGSCNQSFLTERSKSDFLAEHKKTKKTSIHDALFSAAMTDTVTQQQSMTDTVTQNRPELCLAFEVPPLEKHRFALCCVRTKIDRPGVGCLKKAPNSNSEFDFGNSDRPRLRRRARPGTSPRKKGRPRSRLTKLRRPAVDFDLKSVNSRKLPRFKIQDGSTGSQPAQS
jgi:hypothetical protein